MSRGPGESTGSVDSTSAYGAGPVLVYALRARLEKYGDDVRRRPIVPNCRKVVSAGAATAAGCRLESGLWVPRQLSENDILSLGCRS